MHADVALRANVAKHAGFHVDKPVSKHSVQELKRAQRGSGKAAEMKRKIQQDKAESSSDLGEHAGEDRKAAVPEGTSSVQEHSEQYFEAKCAFYEAKLSGLEVAAKAARREEERLASAAAEATRKAEEEHTAYEEEKLATEAEEAARKAKEEHKAQEAAGAARRKEAELQQLQISCKRHTLLQRPRKGKRRGSRGGGGRQEVGGGVSCPWTIPC